jgi:hypothetical protein
MKKYKFNPLLHLIHKQQLKFIIKGYARDAPKMYRGS